MKRLLEKLESKLMAAPEPWNVIVATVLVLLVVLTAVAAIIVTIEYNLWQILAAIALYFVVKAFYVVFFTKH
jgi:hypothetical protein